MLIICPRKSHIDTPKHKSRVYISNVSSPLPTPHKKQTKPPTNNLTVLYTTKPTTYNGSHLHRQDF